MAKDIEGEEGKTYLDGLTVQSGVKTTDELIQDTEDEARWREMTASNH